MGYTRYRYQMDSKIRLEVSVPMAFLMLPRWVPKPVVSTNFFPIGSMYGIYTYIWLICMVNVAKYAIHGYYGFWKRIKKRGGDLVRRFLVDEKDGEDMLLKVFGLWSAFLYTIP